MAQPIEVEVVAGGQIRALHGDTPLPTGRALLLLLDDQDISSAMLAEPSLAEDWLTPEEDAAWTDLQQKQTK